MKSVKIVGKHGCAAFGVLPAANLLLPFAGCTSPGQTETTLTTAPESGVRLLRSRETNLGAFCADVYRVVEDADRCN